MTTINDIARLANVSRSTVSRCLNNNGYVSEEAKERIDKVIKETGYMPSQSAQTLRTKKSGVVGVILPKISTETASRVVSGINAVLQNNGFQLLLTDTSLDPAKEIEFIRLLQAKHVDGIILLATNTEKELLQAIEASKVPIVALGQEIPNIASVTYSDYAATQDMLAYFLEKGHKHIGYIGVYEEDPAVGVIRKQAFMDKMKQLDLVLKDNWVEQGDFSIESGYEAMKRMVESDKSNLPTAVFVATDNMAIGTMQYLKEASYRIPADIAVGSIGASTLSAFVEPTLTTVDFLNEEAGERVATLMLQAFNGKKNTEKLRHSYRLIKRDSV
ncbi:LacI family DNA-binding transcriptional regulator [Saliterribacillus persicus]|uniref:LacI family transcriptional regulator n=1 Tax=Saliterribacillus persicus TaxID=930114 RepID=A0A368Y9R8_9BACI|nr:LacI family DNA-binding transcriptional regulator [Saliterribacillus persicus]RCW74934.1 LacI family transcriptional regulator [Saliterribacillus persicus]